MAVTSGNTESATVECPEMSIGRLSEMKTTSLGNVVIVLPRKTPYYPILKVRGMKVTMKIIVFRFSL